MAPQKQPLPPVPEPPAVTIPRLVQGLEAIRDYPLPTYTFNNEKYVKLFYANALREFARRLLDGDTL